MKLITKVKRHGGSWVIYIPVAIRKYLNLQEQQDVYMDVLDDKIIITEDEG